MMGVMKPSDLLQEHAKVCASLRAADIESATSPIIAALKNGGKVLVCGNGGSAADAQHFAAELSGRYLQERKALPGIALTTDTSALTAISNDYGFGRVFARQVEALGKKGDVLVLLSTSGDSENLLEAAKAARSMGIPIVALLGRGGGRLKPLCDKSFVVASDSTPTIQEMHILIIHCICGLVDDAFAIRSVPHKSG
jgi:D-sedoheptulose 7-phosphate isomerase